MNNNKHKADSILLVGHGSAIASAQDSYRYIQQAFTAKFSPLPVFFSETSSLTDTLYEIKKTGKENPLIQPLYLTEGETFKRMEQLVKEINRNISVARPLLTRKDDLPIFADAVFSIISTDREKSDAVIFMGHGSRNSIAESLYSDLAKEFQFRDSKVFLANLEGNLAFASVCEKIREKSIYRVWLYPLLMAVGTHVLSDMAGANPYSWSSILKSCGIEVAPVMKGLGEYDVITDLLIKKSEAIINTF